MVKTKTKRSIDDEALERALQRALVRQKASKRARRNGLTQIEGMLRDQPRREVLLFASYSEQMDSLKLRPWMFPRCWLVLSDRKPERIRLIGDGDLSAGIAAAVIGTGVHAVMGSGGAPEGVITAAAIRCLNGYMQGRLVIDKPELEERIARMGIKEKNKVYEAEDLAPGKQLIFAATGVTDGSLMKGVRFFGEGTRTSSVILTLRTGKVRFIDSIHLEKGPDVKVRFV